MRKQIVLVGIFLMMLILGLSGCTDTSDDVNKFIGTWRYEVYDDSNLTMVETLTFFENGTLYTNRTHLRDTSEPPVWVNYTVWSNYTVSDGRFCNIGRDSDYEFCRNYIFKENDTKLRITYEGTAADYVKIT